MNRYSLYCTEAQTRKALELGAPIEKICFALTDDWQDEIPTAEQMIGWLEEKGLKEGITIGYAEGIEWYFGVNNLSERFISINFNSRKEATLAAIDAALEYLTNNKK